MEHPDEIRIQITRITIYFRPPDRGMKPAPKPRTPLPFIDRLFADITECFEENDPFTEENMHGSL